MSDEMKVGDKVKLSDDGREQFPKLKYTTGVVTEVKLPFVKVRRGPCYITETWHVNFWEVAR